MRSNLLALVVSLLTGPAGSDTDGLSNEGIVAVATMLPSDHLDQRQWQICHQQRELERDGSDSIDELQRGVDGGL